MVQQIVYTDEEEDKIVESFAAEWECSKADTIKRMIRDFKKRR